MDQINSDQGINICIIYNNIPTDDKTSEYSHEDDPHCMYFTEVDSLVLIIHHIWIDITLHRLKSRAVIV